MYRIPNSILSDPECTRGGSRGACSCGHSENDHGDVPGCRGEACFECACADYDPACNCGIGAPHDRRDRLTLTLPGVGGLTDAELRQALGDPARDVEASRELARRGLDALSPCSTSGRDTCDPFIHLAGDTGEVGALATCALCGARLRLVAGSGLPVFPVHRAVRPCALAPFLAEVKP